MRNECSKVLGWLMVVLVAIVRVLIRAEAAALLQNAFMWLVVLVIMKNVLNSVCGLSGLGAPGCSA